jgi:hypothetical protein
MEASVPIDLLWDEQDRRRTVEFSAAAADDSRKLPPRSGLGVVSIGHTACSGECFWVASVFSVR